MKTAISFLSQQTLFRRDLVCRNSNRKLQKLSPLYKMAEYSTKGMQVITFLNMFHYFPQ